MTKTRNKHERIFAMGANYVERLNGMLASGKSSIHAAKVIQEDWGFFPDMKRDALERALRRYAEDEIVVPLVARQEVVARAKRPSVKAKLLKAADELDVKTEHVRLIQLQIKRLKKYTDRESQMPIPLSGTGPEIKLLNELLKTYEMFLLETGGIRRAPRDVRALVGQLDGDRRVLESFEAEIQQTDETRKAIVEILQIMRTPDEDLPLLEFDAGEELEYELVREPDKEASTQKLPDDRT